MKHLIPSVAAFIVTLFEPSKHIVGSEMHVADVFFHLLSVYTLNIDVVVRRCTVGREESEALDVASLLLSQPFHKINVKNSLESSGTG